MDEQLAWGRDDAGSWLAAPGSNDARGPGPLNFKSGPSQSAREEPGPTDNVCPQRLVHRGVKCARAATVGSAHVLVVDEELVEVRKAAQPTELEDTWRRP